MLHMISHCKKGFIYKSTSSASNMHAFNFINLNIYASTYCVIISYFYCDIDAAYSRSILKLFHPRWYGWTQRKRRRGGVHLVSKISGILICKAQLVTHLAVLYIILSKRQKEKKKKKKKESMSLTCKSNSISSGSAALLRIYLWKCIKNRSSFLLEEPRSK